jgi:hypothetical protein
VALALAIAAEAMPLEHSLLPDVEGQAPTADQLRVHVESDGAAREVAKIARSHRDCAFVGFAEPHEVLASASGACERALTAVTGVLSSAPLPPDLRISDRVASLADHLRHPSTSPDWCSHGNGSASLHVELSPRSLSLSQRARSSLFFLLSRRWSASISLHKQPSASFYSPPLARRCTPSEHAAHPHLRRDIFTQLALRRGR